MPSAFRSLLIAVALCGGAPRLEAQRALAPFSHTTALRVVADSTPIDSTVAHDSAASATPARGPIGMRPSRSPKLFYLALAGGLLANRTMHLDSDPGGYKDGFHTQTMFNDKMIHGLSAWVLVNAGTDLKLSPWRSAATVSAVGVAFEFTQGYVSKYDIAADVTGAIGAAAWRSWRNHVNGK